MRVASTCAACLLLLRERGVEDAVSADGKTVAVVGYASLLSPASVKETTPTMTNFRYGIVKDHCRIFRLASIIHSLYPSVFGPQRSDLPNLFAFFKYMYIDIL